MRMPFAPIAIALMLSPLAAASTTDAPVAVQLVAVNDVAVLVSWSPVPEADFYKIYRGTDSDNLQFLASTSLNHHLDESSQPNAVYGVSVVQNGMAGPITLISSAGGGDCVAANTGGHVTITLANCIRKG